MRITAEPRSDQWNAEDFIAGPRTFTIAGVRGGTAEQKYDVLLEGEERVWRPPLTVLRLLMKAWGDDSTAWIGRRVTLFNDESVRFGKEATGGIRVSHMSNLPDGKRFTVRLTSTRGKKAAHSVDPLPDAAPTMPDLTTDDITGATDLTILGEMWKAHPGQRAAIEARVAELKAESTGDAEIVDEGAQG